MAAWSHGSPLPATPRSSWWLQAARHWQRRNNRTCRFMERVMTTNAGPLCGLASALFALTLVCGQQAAAAPPSTFGAKVVVGEAHDGYVGTLDVLPDHG